MSELKAPPISLLDVYEGSEVLPLYSTTVTVKGGQAGHGRASGHAESVDGNLSVDLRLPVEMGGAGGGTNPEQLFAAGYAACFHGALTLAAAKAKTPARGAEISVSVTFGRDPGDGLFLLTADVAVTIPNMDPATAEALVRETERLCPYAKMTREGIESTVRLVS
ncbi:MAG: Ohr family peroxiredoxin [Antricoccus sp.]